MILETRVAVNSAMLANQYRPPKDSYTRELHARLLSNLAHLETIAVEAARRGDGIENQLEDELVHQAVFTLCAEKADFLYPADKPTQALIDYLKNLEGKDSVHILNIVAEGWLETVFHYLAKVDDFIPHVFKLIEEDEHRHSHEAREQKVELGEDTEQIVRDIEKLLFEIANSPFFMLPMVRILGRMACSRMGEALARSHETSCLHLGITPRVSKIKALARNGRNLLKNAPEPVKGRPWDEIKSRMWTGANDAAQVLYTEVSFPSNVKINPVSAQLRLCRAIGLVYQMHPQLLRVYRHKKLWEPTTPILGLRLTHKDRDQVGTIFFNPTKYRSDHRLLKMINTRKARMNKAEYEDIPNLAGLEKYMYPSYAVATVSSNAGYGGLFGCGPLIDIEGIGTAYTIGEIQYKVKSLSRKEFLAKDAEAKPSYEAMFVLAIKMDHRMSDGKDIGFLAQEVKRQFEREGFV